MDENLRQIYDKLVQSGSKGSYEQFVEYFNANDNNKRSVYEKLVKAGSKGTYEQFMDYVGQTPKRMTVEDVGNQNNPSVVTFDKNTTSFDDWYQTVPVDRNDTTHYNLRRAYELAPAEELEAWRTATPEELEKGEKHLRSVYENKNGEYEFMKSRNHPTLQMELDWYNSDDADAVEFKRKYRIETEGGKYYKYVSRGFNLDDMSMENAAKNAQLLESVNKEISSMQSKYSWHPVYGKMLNDLKYDVKYNDLLYQQELLTDYVNRLKGSDEYRKGVQEVHSFNDQFREENNLVRGDAMSKLRKHNFNLFGASGRMFMLEKFMHMSNIDMNMLAPGQEDMYNDAAADFAIYGAEQKVRLAEDELANGTGGFGTQFARGWRNSNWNKLDKQMTLNMALQAYKIAKKFDENGELLEGQTLSESETRLFKALQIAYLADNTVVETMWERIGENAPEQVKYTLEFILTSELMGASALSKGIAGAATRNIENKVAKKLVYKVADYTAQPLLQTLYNPLNWMEGSIERQTGNLTYDENTGNFAFAGAQNEWDATRNAIVSAWIENFSEKIGEDIFKPAKYGNKYLRNMDNAFGRTYNQFATKIDVAIENAGLNKLDDVLKISKDIRLATGVQGIPGEYVEEVVGGIMDAMFVGDQSFHQYDENGNPNPNYLWNSEQQLETFLSCAVMSIGMTTVSNIRNGAVGAAERRKAKSYLNQMAKAMQNQNIDTETIDKAFENGTINDVSDIVFRMGSAEDMTDDKRQILSNYVAAKINYAAMRNADMSAIEDSFSDIEKEAYASVNAETKDAGGAGGRIIQANVEVNGETFEGVPIVSGRVLTRIETDANGNDYMVLDTRGSSSVLYIRVPGEEKARPIYSSQVKSIVAATNVDEYIEKQKNILTGMMTDMFGAQYDGGLTLEQLVAECAVLSDKEMQIGKTSVSLEKGRKYHVFDNRSGKIVEAAFVEDTQMDGEQYHVFNINGENMEMTDSELKESMLRYRLQLAEESGVQDEAAQIELDALLRERDADMAIRPVSEDQMIETVVSSEAAMDESGNFTADSNPKAVAVAVLKSCGYDLEKAIASLQKSIYGLAAQTAQNVVSQQSGETASPSLEENVANANAVSDGTVENAGIIGMYRQAIEEAKLYMKNFVGEPEVGETYALTNDNGTVYGRFEGYDADGNVQYRETDESGENDGRLVVLPKNEFQKQRRAHNIEIQAQKPITIENAQEIAEETPVIPTETITENAEENAVVPPVEETPVKEEIKLPRDKDNNIDYKQITDPALYAKGLTEEFGDDAQSVIDELIADEKKNLEKAGTKNAIERRRAQKAAQSSIDFYNHVKNTLTPKPSDDVKVKNVAPKDSKAFEKRIATAINEIGEPTSFEDEVLRRLANSSHQFKWGSDGTHKGMGATLGFKGGGSEMISRASFLSKNGKYFDEVALDIWQDLPEAYNENHTDQEVRDLMIDFLRSYSNPFEMVDAIRQMQLGARNGETIDEAADRQQEESIESIAASYGMTVDEFNEAVYKANELNMSLDEYLAINYSKEEFVKEIALSDEQYENYTNFAAEQILAEEQGEQYDTGRTESDTELHQGEAETAQQGGIRPVVGESTGTGRERGNIGEEREVQQERNQHGSDELPDKGVAAEPYIPRSQRGKDRAVELDNTIATHRGRVASARREYEKTVSDFNKRNGLFGDTEDNDGTLFGDLADFSKENFERISSEKQTEIENEQKRLDELVSNRDKELREIDEAEDKQSALEFAEQEVDTNPTDAQKKAGNYKKGHVTIDGFDISIENPRGSVRSGVDENGNEWSVTMHDTYGYIRNTESVDGDHIDIFLSDHIGNWNGSVFVVDQVKPDGSFDEHKVMYGFDTEEEAREAYLANYSEGWQGLGSITVVSKNGFKKWIESSHRKTKPFAEYKEILLGHQKEESKRVFKEDEKDRRLEALRRRHGSQLNMNINPQDLEDLLYVAGYHIENGVRKFADFCKGMITDLGDWVRPYLKQIYSACKYDEDIAKLNVPFEEWTEDREVSTFDVANFDKETEDLAQTVEMVENEKKAEENINEINTQNEQTAANTEAIVSEAETLADQAESDVENITTEQQGNEIADNIDNAIEKVNEQLALLGYYEADTDDESQFHESYGYMRTAEKKAVKDMERLARQVAKDLGIEVGRKQLAKANIAPAGGDVSFRLPLTDSKELHLWVRVVPNGYTPGYGYADDLVIEDMVGIGGGVLRIEDPKASGIDRYGHNHNFSGKITYDDLIREIKFQIAMYDKEFYDKMQEKLAAKESAEKNEKKTKKTPKQSKNSLTLQQSLFDTQDDNELKEDNNGQQQTETTGGENRLSTTEVSSGESAGEQSAINSGLESSVQKRRDDNRRDSGVQEGIEPVSSGSGRSSGRIQGLRNQNNNHAERGTDYAPKSVDARIEANIKAIELMQQLIESGEQATPEQMATLRQFSGWGGLGKAFTDNPYGYSPNARLKALLGEEAYEQANMSRNSAYYTPANVIDTLWDIAKALGFKGGNILEGSAGIGNILGLMPSEISGNSNIHAVEIDQTAGNILSLLYPDANVEVQGFEATKIENGSIDLAITNVPFVTGLRVNDITGDKDLSKKFHDIHDFCIAKNIRKLREGGIGIFITSSGTLDNSARLREWIVSEGNTDVVGAFRLNNETFGGTGATSDIIVVRKRVNGVKSPNAIDVSDISSERVAEYKTGDVKKVKGEYVAVTKQLSMDYNAYYIAHPDMMAGKMYFGFEKDDNYRATSKALYPASKNQNEMLANWAKSFSKMDWSSNRQAPAEATTNVYESLGDNIKEGSMLVNKKGVLCIAQRGSAVPLDVNANKVKGHTKVECFNSYQSIKQALADVLNYQTQNDDDSGLKPLLDKLNRVYDSFIRTYGNLHKNTSITFLKNDVDFANVLALETFKETGDANGNKIQVYGKTDVFTKRVVEKDKAPEPTNIKDGIIASIYLHGRVDIPYLSKQLNMSEDEVRDEIINQGLGFENPSSREIEVSYEYLSGNVRDKLEQAIENNVDGRYDNNIKELEKVIPMTIPPHLIDFSIGSSWIDPQLYVDYIKERTDISVEIAGAGGSWFIKTPYFVNEQKNRTFGVFSKQLYKLIYGTLLIDAAMNNRTITVSETHKKYDGSTETIIDKEATQACANKIDEIRQDFKDWAKAKMQSDTEMSQRIERVYNDMFNNYVPKDIPDDFVPAHFAGQATEINGKPFNMRPHQAKAVIRATTQPLMLAHEVGTGKTFTLISTAMEMRRLGTAKKPMIVVQNATVGQFVESAKQLYPNAKVLTIEDKDHTGEGRKNFYAKIKYNDWDMIVVPQSVFERIPDSDERQIAFVQDKIEEKLLVLEQMRDADSDGNSMVVKQAERELSQLEDQKADIAAAIQEKRKKRDEKKEAVTKQNAEVKALEMLDRATDDVENFDDMGIDAILVDEAHEYKHLGFATAMQRGVKGVDPSYSKKAQGVFLKTQAVLEKNNGRNVVFATGTPISNTAAEIWTFMRYLMPADTMKNYDIYYFDDFVRNFGNLQQMLEFATSGKLRENNRFAGYMNLPELVRIWSSVTDTVLTREAGGVNDKIPDMEGGKAQDIYLPQTKALRSVIKYVESKLEEYENMTGKQKKENSHIPLVMYGIAKAAAVDARLVVDEAEDDPNSKTNEAVRQILRSLDETKAYKGTVAVFADNYQNKHSKFNIYDDIKAKLVEAGIPENQIVIMKSGMSVKKKLEIFDKMNSGEVRVMMGSTFTLGTGVNIQERLHTLIHLDAPNRPMDYTQRNGRILRQGNLHKQMGKPVRVLRFGVEDSLDVTAYQRLKTKGAIADSIMNGKAMMINNMENRVLEEEEDVFGDIVAQLSGSEYAMLKNQAEKDVRKYEAKYKQWQADQIYVRNELPNVKTRIEYNKKAIADAKKALDTVKKAYNGNLDIKIGKLKFNSIDGMKDFITEYNKSIMAAENEVKNANGGEQTRSLTININGIDFVVNTTVKYEMLQKGTTLSYVARRNMRYSCAQLGLEDIPVKQSLVRNAIDDIVYNIMTGKEFESDIQSDQAHLDRYEKSYEQLKQRDGKEFEYTAELEASHKRLDEYTAKMKEEMEEKEKKYAEMDADVEAIDVDAEKIDLSEDDADDAQMQVSDEEITSDYAAAEAVINQLKSIGITVHEISEEEADESLDDADVQHHVVKSDEEKSELEEALKDGTEKRYCAMQVIDGKLYPVMSAYDDNGEIREASEIGQWEKSDEDPDAADANGNYRLRKTDSGKGRPGMGDTPARYNPYFHVSDSPLNDQFSGASTRPNVVIVEVEVPVSEKTSGYHAENAKDSVGELQWHSGPVNSQLTNQRTVMLSRWRKPVRIVPYSEVADMIVRQMGDDKPQIPFNTLHPELRGELEKRGVEINDNWDSRTGKGNPFKNNISGDNSTRLKTDDGIVYGYTKGGEIYINRERLNPDTPIHEYTHLWDAACRQANPELWRRGVELMKQTSEWARVMADENYRDIRDDEDKVASEVHSRLAGREGARILGQMQREAEEAGTAIDMIEKMSLLDRVKTWVNDFWKWVKDTLVPWTREEAAKVSVEDFVKMPMGDLFRGVNPNEYRDRTIEQLDREYMEAVRRGDMETAQRMVIEAARRAMPNTKVVDGNGNPLVVYHGSHEHFTKFSHEKSGGLFNFADEKHKAQRYAFGNGGARTRYTNVLISNHSDIAWAQKGDNYEIIGTVIRDSEGEYVGVDRNAMPTNFKGYRGYKYKKTYTIREIGELEERDFDEYAEQFSYIPENANTRAFFLNVKGLLDISEGWHYNIKHTAKQKLAIGVFEDIYKEAKETQQDGKVFFILNKILHVGREYEFYDFWDATKYEAFDRAFEKFIAGALKRRGFDGIYHIDDSHKTYVVFDSNQIKSAEPVTYDDNGEVIPLSKRFDIGEDDTRYQIIQAQNEVDDIVSNAGRKPQIREDGAITDKQINELNADIEHSKQLAFDAVRNALAKAGIEVIEATDEEVQAQKEKVLHNANGTLMGWVDVDGKIHLSKSGMNAETAIHEYTHLWVEGMRTNNLELWEQIRDMLIKDNPMYDEIRKSPAYANIKNNNDKIAEEILARISGKQNAKRIEDAARKLMDENPGTEGAIKAASLIERLRDALNRFWTWCGKTLFGKKGNITVDQVTEMVLADLVNNVNPDNIPGKGRGIKLSVEGETTEADTEDFNEVFVTGILNNKLGIDNADMRRKTMKRHLIEQKRKWMDSLDPLKKLQQSIAEATGKPLADFEDAYNAELRRASISLPMIERYTDDYLLPMIESVGDILKEGVDEKTLGLYLIAKHGLERNEYFKKLNDWKEVQDMSGLTALAAELDRGDEDFTQVAKDFVNEIENTVPKDMLKNMWSRINDTTNAILAKYLESGLISKKQYDDYRKRYNNYVPLRGWDETTSDEFYNYSVLDQHFQSAIKQAKGRTSLANNVLANIMNMTESAVVIGEKNKVLQRLFNLAQGRKSDVLKTQRSWYVKNQQGEWEETMPIITEDMTPEQVKRAVEEFEENMSLLSAKGEAKQTLNRADVGVKIKPFNVHEHYVPVFVNGRKHAIIINADPTIVKSLTDSNELANTKFVSALRNTTRFMSQLNTTFNPEFIVKNVLRDAGMAMISSYIEGGMKYANKVRSNINLFGRRYLGQLIRNGECDNTEITQYWKEFIENGGETGFTRTLNVDEQAKRLKKLYKKMLSGKDIDQKGMFETITSAIDSFNRWGEDLSRFAVFVTNRQIGKTVEQSVNMAKNATINFQRKGGGTLAAWFRTTRSFFNAGMQALYRFGSLAKNNPKRFAIASTAIVISGLLVPALNIMMLSLIGGDDDDWNAYRFMSEFTGNHSWHMFVGDGFITIPYPQEFAALFAAGNIVFRHAIGWADKDSTIAGDIFNMALEQMPFDMGGGGSIDWKIMNAVTPQVLQPFVEVYINEDFIGRPIYKKNPFNENNPAWTKAFKSTSGTLVELAKRLNGNDPVMKHSKYFDWLDNPAAWQHIITGEAGGIGRIVSNVSRLVENGYTADNMPFLRNLYMTSDMNKFAPQVMRDYYNLLNGFDEMKNNINGYDNDGESLYDNLDRYMKLKTSPEYKAYLATKDLTKTIKEKQDNLKLMQAYDAKDEDIETMRNTITSLQIMVLDITNNMIIEEGRPLTKEFRQVIDNIRNGEEE